MTEPEKFYPNEQNLGKTCVFWELGGVASKCCYPKFELEGRTTCRGSIDDVCLYIKDGRKPGDFSQMLLEGVKASIPNSSLLPPGDLM